MSSPIDHAGLRRYFKRFGPGLKVTWSNPSPMEYNDAVGDLIAAQGDAAYASSPMEEMERRRDDTQIVLLWARIGGVARREDIVASHQSAPVTAMAADISARDGPVQSLGYCNAGQICLKVLFVLPSRCVHSS